MRYLILVVFLLGACTKTNEAPVTSQAQVTSQSLVTTELPKNPDMNVPQKAFELLVDLEGMEAIPYQDGNGRSVGYGFAIAHLTPDELELIENVENVTEEEAKAVLKIKIKKIIKKMDDEIDQWDSIEGSRRLSLISMAFQLGVENVLAISPNKGKNWPRFIGYVKEASISKGMKRESLFKKAADEMILNVNSKGRKFKTFWYKSTPKRAILMNQLLRGRGV
jgi:GH24 family phage-related lysozyme (muramidase)